MLRYKKIMSAETGYRDQMLARHDGQWVKYDEAQAEIAGLQALISRLRKNLVGNQAAARKRRMEVKGQARQISKLQAQLAAMTAERDALVGAAYKAAARMVTAWSHPDDVAAKILRLTTADATTALDHMIAQAKAEGWRKAAQLVEKIGEEARQRNMMQAAMGAFTIRDALLAAAEKEAGQ